MNEQTHAKFSIPVKATSGLRSSDKQPKNGLRWPENGQLLSTDWYFRQLITYCFDEKKVYVSRYTIMAVQTWVT
jgi:hypothetical protein